MWFNNGGEVTEVRASDGVTVGQFPIAGQFGGDDIAFDGQYIWAVLSGTSFYHLGVAKLNLSGKIVAVSNFTLVVGLAFDGANMWVTNGLRIKKM